MDVGQTDKKLGPGWMSLIELFYILLHVPAKSCICCNKL